MTQETERPSPTNPRERACCGGRRQRATRARTKSLPFHPHTTPGERACCSGRRERATRARTKSLPFHPLTTPR